MQNVSRSGHLVLDPFAEAISTAKECLLLDKQKTFVECGKDVSSLEKSMPRPYAGLCFSALARRSDLTSKLQVKGSAPVYLAAVRCARLRESVDSWVPHLLRCLYRRFRSLW